MVEATGQRRFRVSIRTLMIAVALCALFLAPLGWMYRRVELPRRMEMVAVQHARALAEERAAAFARSAKASLSATKTSTTDKPKTGSLWAGLSVKHSIFKAGQTRDLRIEFTLVNDGDKVIDPKIAESRIIINGKELADSASVLTSTSKDAPFTALAPGQSLQFDCPLGDHFKEPGTYPASWKGAGFQSSEIVLRVLPEKAR